MDKNIFTQKICELLNIDRYEVIKKKYGSVPQITMGSFMEAIYAYETIPKIAEYYNVSVQTINRILRSIFPEIRLLGKVTWKYHLLSMLNIKVCSGCSIPKDFSEFYNSSNSAINTMSRCKVCDKEWTQFRQKHYPERHRAANAKRKATLLNAIPSWADSKAIAVMYAQCPEGYHVDHIIPLQGLNVCGLHVENNLQYLTAEENHKKSNKY